MLLGIAIALVAVLYEWTGRSPQREKIAAWSTRRALATCIGAWALAFLLDPDHGIVRQGPHMWIVGPIVWALLLGGPVLFVRWTKLRRSSGPTPSA